MMNPEIHRILLSLIVILLVVSSGCTTTTAPAPQTTVPVEDTIMPHPTATLVTRVPESEVARIVVGHFGMDPSTETVYEFVGTVGIGGGVYRSVEVVLRYPDTQEYVYEAGGMGGANQTIKPVFLFPADRYRGTNPEKIVVLDGKRYGTVYRYENGVLAWVATSDTLIPA